MSSRAAIQGSYSDFKLVKSRGQAQIVIEIPIEKAEGFVASFGMPIPGAEKPVALALLNPPAPDKPAPSQGASVGAEKKRWSDMSRAQQAGVLCHDESFVEWIGAADEEEAAGKVRERCGVKSRSELDKVGSAGRLWDAMVAGYRQSSGQMAEQRW